MKSDEGPAGGRDHALYRSDEKPAVLAVAHLARRVGELLGMFTTTPAADMAIDLYVPRRIGKNLVRNLAVHQRCQRHRRVRRRRSAGAGPWSKCPPAGHGMSLGRGKRDFVLRVGDRVLVVGKQLNRSLQHQSR